MNLGTPQAREAAWALVPATASVDKALQRTRDFIRHGVVHPGGPVDALEFNGGAMWSSTSDRSHLRRLHGLLFAADWITAGPLLEPGEAKEFVSKADAVVMDWVQRFGARTDAPEMAYHDETTAQRLMILTALAAAPAAGQSSLPSVFKLAQQTAELLEQPAFYAGTNNHGMFQDIALLVYAVLFDAACGDQRAQLAALAFDRVKEYAAVSFTAEGVHIEHSPTYHLMVARSLAGVHRLAMALGDSKFGVQLGRLVEKAERYATHAITPRGVFPPVSDTTQTRLDTPANLAVFTSDAFRFAASQGRDGRPANDPVAVFAESGYAIYRSSWSDPDGVYCFFTAAYNGGYHKHSDELSLHVEVAGKEVIREAGPNGYNYSDPFTQYAFSSFAHNTLVVDDKGLARHDGRMSKTEMRDAGSTATTLDVVGVTSRFPGVRFERRLSASGDSREAAVITVQDAVTSDEEHQYRFFWHLGPKVEPVVHGDFVELFVGGKKILEVAFQADSDYEVTVTRGQEEPRLSGWAFPVMGRRVETSTICITLYSAKCSIMTTMRTGSFLLRDRGVRPSGSEWNFRSAQVPLTYLLDVPDGEVRGLVAVFSAINPRYDFTYNYRSALEGLPLARLFVLDNFGEQGAYYYSRRRSLLPFLAVQALLRDVADALSLPWEAVYTAGSSKGGTAALVHGFALGAGRVIAGAPQTRVGTFLKSPHPDLLEYMSGGSRESDVLWADNIVPQALQNSSPRTKVSILVGEADHHLRGHVEPFIKLAGPQQAVVHTLVIPDAPHARIGQSFRQYLRSHLEWASGMGVAPHCLSVSAHGILHLTLSHNADTLISTKLFHGQDVLDATPYERGKQQYRWENLPAGRYRVRVYLRQPGSEQVAFTTVPVTLSREAGG